MILRDYRCPDHGLFESAASQCPTDGCTAAVTVAFLKPVGHISRRTKGFDRDLRMQAESFGMTNLRSAREGDNQLGFMPDSVNFGEVAPEAWRQPESVKWGSAKFGASDSERSLTTYTGGAAKLDIAETTASPIQKLSPKLKDKTLISHLSPKKIIRTQNGLVE